MPGSLRARLIVSFAAVVGLAVFLAGAGALFLLRDQQQENARERYGRHLEPLNDQVAAQRALGATLADVSRYLSGRAEDLGARVIMLDQDLLVVYDSAGDGLLGRYIISFENPDVEVIEEEGARFKWTNYGQEGADLTLFAAPPADASSGDSFAAAEYSVLLAIPRDELASAWLDLAPRLALAGAIALVVSFAVAWFISRSISGPLQRITEASQAMARGNYDVYIPIKGQDEVGRLSEAFNHMAQEVSRSQHMMRDLLANVSHELKTPLTSIQGFSQAMLDGAIQSDEEFRESTQIINDEANRMRALVDDLLLLSQIESGQVEMEHRNIDIGGLLERTLQRFQWALREGDVRSGVSIEPLPLVTGDERRLEQVFGNLLQNAVRHTPPGGAIAVTASVLRDGSVSIAVHNTGSYIPPEDLPRVFERFYQVDRARTRRAGSSGLGLAIVKEIIDAHGGTVRAISDAETGTEFVIILPAAKPTPARSGRAAVPPQAKSSRAPRERQAPAG